jgi:hypothetical protein
MLATAEGSGKLLADPTANRCPLRNLRCWASDGTSDSKQEMPSKPPFPHATCAVKTGCGPGD